jgi:hypothetical protein
MQTVLVTDRLLDWNELKAPETIFVPTSALRQLCLQGTNLPETALNSLTWGDYRQRNHIVLNNRKIHRTIS